MTEEMHKLDHNAGEAFEAVNARFKAALDAIEAKRQDVFADVKLRRDEKKKILEDQLRLIQAEKSKVDSDVQVSLVLLLMFVILHPGCRIYCIDSTKCTSFVPKCAVNLSEISHSSSIMKVFYFSPISASIGH